ncbi:MAG: Flp family type IVb pilin [Desulfurivibrionaceae bacterium]
MEKMKKMVTGFLKEEEGVTALEYGLIAALIAVVIIGAVTLLGENVETTFNDASNAMPGGNATS